MNVRLNPKNINPFDLEVRFNMVGLDCYIKIFYSINSPSTVESAQSVLRLIAALS